MTAAAFRFERFTLDPHERQLRRDDQPVELNGRYFDALALLLREQGKLVSKDRFLDEVWRGVPVTDEALTQCVKTLRRQLGDNASSPNFIETVPKHGYRFIAPVEQVAIASSAKGSAEQTTWSRFVLIGTAGTLGGGLAGLVGGLFYGFAGASQPLQPGIGALSVLLVVVCLSLLIGLIGGAGVSFGIAAAGLPKRRSWQWNVVGGALGGLIVGALVKLLGLDAFNLLVGQTPGNITGAAEGALLGAAVGLGAWLGGVEEVSLSLRRSIGAAALTGALGGIAIGLLGGRLMGGSLDLLARHFPRSHLRLDSIGYLLGERSFGPMSLIVSGALEAMLFAGCIVGAMIVARRSRWGR